MAFTHAVSTNNYGPAKFIVSASAANGTHTTIASASADAVSGETVFIRPGTYTEDWSAKAGVNYCGFVSDGFEGNVILKGLITCNYSGVAQFGGLQFSTNGASCFSFTGSSACGVGLVNCNIVVEAGQFFMIANNASCFLTATECIGNVAGGLFNITSCTSLGLSKCNIGWAQNSSIAVGLFQPQWSAAAGPITTSSTGSVVAYYSTLSSVSQATITLAGTGTATLYNCTFGSSNQAALSIGTGCSATMIGGSITSTAANAVTGAGTFFYSNVTFGGSSITINPTTQTMLPALDTGQVGTFTPTIQGASTAGTGTYSVQQGRYQKVGRLVTFHVNLTWSAHTGTGVIQLAGLPFAAASTETGYPFSFVSLGSFLVATATSIICYGVGTTTVANIYGYIAASGSLVNSSLASNTATSCYISGTYEV